MNPLLLRFFLRQRINATVLWGGAIGLAGIAVLVWPSLAHGDGAVSLVGLGFALCGTAVAALGDVISTRNAQVGIRPVQANTHSIFYGCLSLGVALAWAGVPVVIPREPSYWMSIVWLGAVGTALVWQSYLTLLQRIGAVRTGMMVLFYPVVSILASAVLEGLQITPRLVLGIAMIMGGNAAALLPRSDSLLSSVVNLVQRRQAALAETDERGKAA
jgi:drug/metabolite transporter (DMT)-like permease